MIRKISKKVTLLFLANLLSLVSVGALAQRSIFFRAHDDSAQHGILFSAESPKARLLILHGLQSHAGWYDVSGTGQALAEAGITSFALDRRGSGRSGTLRGHAETAETLLEDILDALDTFNKNVSDEERNLPIHVMANCFGTRILLPFVERYPGTFASIVLTSPATHMKDRVEYGFLEKVDINFSNPKSYVETTLKDYYFISERSPALDFINSDPWALRMVTASFLWAAKDLTAQMYQSAAEIRDPVFVILAKRDAIVVNSKIYKEFYLPLKSKDKKISLLDSEHSLDFGDAKEDYRTLLKNWILKR